MNRHLNHPHNIVRNPAYRQAFQRLDEALQENAPFSNAEKIKLMRQVMFADVEAFQLSDKLVIPK